MTGALKRTTPNYNIPVPKFDETAWQGFYEQGVDIIDAAIFAFTGININQGVWDNATVYAVNDRAVDADNGTLWSCLVGHTSASSGTFAADRAANSSYWAQVTSAAVNGGTWTTSTAYATNTYIEDGYRVGIVTNDYTSGASYNADVSNGDVVTIVDLTSQVAPIAAISSEIATVAGISANVTTVAGDSADIQTLAAISADISATEAISSDITTVAADATDIGTVATNIANVNTVAGISTNVTTVAAIEADISTVAGDSTDIQALGAISTNITTVAGISADVTSVAADASDIGTVATNISNVNSVASNIINVNAVATNATNINAVAADSVDIGNVSGSIADVNSVAANIAAVSGVDANETNINTVASANTNITAVAGSIANVNTVATNISNVNTVAGISADVTTVAGISTNVTAVASNVTSVNNFADRYQVETGSDPTLRADGSALEAGDLLYRSDTGTTKIYDGTAYNVAVFDVDGAVFGPASSTNNYVPQWNGANGDTLKAGLAVGTGANRLLQLDGSGRIPAINASLVTDLTKSQVGLGNVDNTSDANKPVSTATQTALDGKAATSHTHSNATTGTAGFMSASDKTKLDAVGTMANRAFTVSTSDPSGGSNGDIWFKVT